VRKTIAWILAALTGLFGLFGLCAAHAADLTAEEHRWLQATWPVLTFARNAGMPLDIVVQPQPTAGLPPVGLAFKEGRCKLVFSMRGNPEVQATLERIEPELFEATLELMAAHELGHCWRHVSGAWGAVPSSRGGHAADRHAAQAPSPSELRQTARREEGYADLVGLAWVQQFRLPLYARLHAWLVAERSHATVAGSPHDTLVWVQLAADAQGFNGGTPFEAAWALWADGLEADD